MSLRFFICFIATLTAGIAQYANAAEPRPYGSQPLVRLPDNRPGVMVVINERGPFLFLVDTASSHTVIVPSLRDRLALPELDGPARDVITAASTVRSRFHGVREIAAAGVILEGGRAVVIDLPESFGIKGVLGAEFLSNFTVDLNLQAQTITLYPYGTKLHPQGMRHVRGQPNEHAFMIVPARVDNVGAAAILDTGGEYTVANPSLVGQSQRFARSVARNMESKVVDAANKRSWAETEDFERITVGDIVWRDARVLNSDMRVFQQLGFGRQPAVFLGMDLLAGHRIIFEYGDASLWLSP